MHKKSLTLCVICACCYALIGTTAAVAQADRPSTREGLARGAHTSFITTVRPVAPAAATLIEITTSGFSPDRLNVIGPTT